jgi:hypothetical protein
MPTNGDSDYLLYGIDSMPIFTYAMIGITTLVLAYATMIDQGEAPTPSEMIENTTTSLFGEQKTANSNILGGNKKNKKTRRHRPH